VRVVVNDISSSGPMVDYPESKADSPLSNPALTLNTEREIKREGRVIGKLQLWMSAENQLATAQHALWLQVGRTAVLAAVSMGLILWVLRRRVLSPMERLASDATALGAGHLNRPLEATGHDEISKVSQAMEQMRQALLEAFDRLRLHASTLEETVEQRTSELTSANGELKQALTQLQAAQRELVESEKLASLGRLVAGVAHELNTPLGNAMTVVTSLEDRWAELAQMLSGGQGLRRSVLDALLVDTRRGLDILQRNVGRAAELVRDFKQVAVDQTSDARREFDLAHMVNDVLVMVEPRYKNTPYQIVTDLAPDLKMNSFPGSLGQVLTNLLINALVHGMHDRPAGSVAVSSRALPGSPGWVELSVRDDGWGMDESVRKRIFDPFFTTKLGRGGTGLGMHIVHNIVTQMLGGQIEVSSTVGQGSQMTLRLPCIAPERKEDDSLAS
jgi:signal transduction histidine kinase